VIEFETTLRVKVRAEVDPTAQTAEILELLIVELTDRERNTLEGFALHEYYEQMGQFTDRAKKFRERIDKNADKSL